MKTLALGAVLALSSTLAFAADPAAGPRPREACKADVAALCSGVQRGGGRIAGCMKEHAAQLSDGCKAAMAQAHGNKRAPSAPAQ
ncbi:MAG: cysteine rich repeat-containing protein [Casimicrobiaceae bacterium]